MRKYIALFLTLLLCLTPLNALAAKEPDPTPTPAPTPKPVQGRPADGCRDGDGAL